ncbi:BNR repeat-containing protein [Martelella alba]|uniref:BNR repeat-containing family member n=1 Tax=Martelella alba TaxID=2590451 RepID=A0ABY2SQ99_9HYPH|nr:BNR repeat-containing protein [Martelella alba]TKI06061.1 hypothetical protein FCN80_11085 [Martelella alba]
MRSEVTVSQVGEACADFTVLYSLLCYHDYLFAAWYDAQHRLTVGARRPGEKHWQIVRPEGFEIAERQRLSTVTDHDSHNYLTMAIDHEGFLHVSGNMHVDPLIYFRSARPLDIASLRCVRAMTGDREMRATYPLFFKDRQGRLLFRYRDGCSGNGDDIYNIYDTRTQTWSRLLDRPLLNGEGARNGYARPPLAGPDGYWHMIWMWRESPHCETNNNLSYARSKDLLHWETSAGQSLSLPITRETGEIVDAAAPGEGLINMVQEVGFDNAGKPVLIYHRYDEQGHSQAYLARPDGLGQWQKQQISAWTFRWDFQGPGSIPPDVTLTAPRPVGNGRLEVEWYSQWVGQGIWVIDDVTLRVLETLPARHVLSAQLLTPHQQLHPDAQVQIIAAQNSDGRPEDRYWLRWESLPICRDIPHSATVGAGQLELIERI